jgi:hypothetical protein
MSAKRAIKNPSSSKSKKPQENLEFDLDSITEELANKSYHSNTSDEPEEIIKTSVDIPESIYQRITTDAFKNKMTKKGPRTNKGIILEALRRYYETRDDE